MNFGKKQLMKYGWKEGSGLGKDASGIVKPILPRLKFDLVGFGFDYGKELNGSFKWWEDVYNKAATDAAIYFKKDDKLDEFNTIVQKQLTKKGEGKFKECSEGIQNKQVGINRRSTNDGSSNTSDIHSDNESSIFRDTNYKRKRKQKNYRKYNGKLARLQAQEEQFRVNRGNVKSDYQ